MAAQRAQPKLPELVRRPYEVEQPQLKLVDLRIVDRVRIRRRVEEQPDRRAAARVAAARPSTTQPGPATCGCTATARADRETNPATASAPGRGTGDPS